MLAEYIYLGDQLLAMIRGGQVYYFHNDHLGTPQILTDDSGTIAWKATYTAFGGTNILTEVTENPHRFIGQYYDRETGLHYNYFRYYNPQTGRYMTPDPIGLEGGINLFSYVENNPLNFMDPLGLQGKKGNKCDPCAHLLPANIPPGVDIEANIALAESMGKDDPYLLVAWFYSQVENKGPWDYKQQGRQYQEFGNFNFGATGSAAGISEGALKRGAGWAQEKAKTSQKQWGHWYSGSPYGDDPADQIWIQKGIEYYKCRRKNKK
jgi:RHS repeat-associated protein